jgi:2'-5' RNA ligase
LFFVEIARVCANENSDVSQMRQNHAWERLGRRYDQLWSEAIGKIRTGEIQIDAVLQARTPDQRRGLTLIGRPSAGVRQSLSAFLRELRRLEPDQYYYTASEFHITVLSLFTATVDFERFFARRELYVAAVDAALRDVQPIPIAFQGVTVSLGTVMIQGFFERDKLNELRNALRRRLRLGGLEKGLDQRYRLQTAHMTVVRFRGALRDSPGFATALENARGRLFGATTLRDLFLVESDWYMSRCATKVLKHYRVI